MAYGGDPASYGTLSDSLIGKKIGGVNVFGGGLALYVLDKTGNSQLVGVVGSLGNTLLGPPIDGKGFRNDYLCGWWKSKQSFILLPPTARHKYLGIKIKGGDQWQK